MKIIIIFFISFILLEAQIIRNQGPGTRKSGSIIRESLYSGGNGTTPIVGIPIDSLQADNLISVGANVNLKYFGSPSKIVYWGDYWNDESSLWFNATLGTASDSISENGLTFPDYKTTGGHTSTSNTALRQETTGYTIFTVWGADRLVSGNYLFGMRILSSNYINIVHLGSDTTIAFRSADGNGNEAIVTLFDPAWNVVSGDSGKAQVHAFQYKPDVDSVYAYRSGEKVGVSLGTWNPSAAYLSSGNLQLNAYNNSETDSDIRDLFILGRVYSTDTVNAVCKWFADRWNLTWTLAE